MRLTDARTGQCVELRAVRRGLLRVCVHLPSGDRPADLGDLRALLVADVLARTAEIEGVQVLLGYAAPGLTEERAKAWARQAGPLGVQPPAGHTDSTVPPAVLGGPVDVHVGAGEPTADGPWLGTGPVCGPDAAGWPDGPEPLAVRLALLGRPHHRPAHLDHPVLADAQARLDHWRRLVADWADAPSRPPHTEAVRRAFTGFHDDLDTATAVAVLRELECASDVPDGARFESYLRLDRVLGLELPRDIGRQRIR